MDGVLLVGHGTVTDLGDLPEFLRRIRGGQTVPPELAQTMRQRYERIGGSPLLRHTEAQARALGSQLGLTVLVGMRFSEPSLGGALAAARHRGIERLCVLPLAPFSVDLYVDAAKRALEQNPLPGLELVGAPHWGMGPGYVEAQALAIQRAGLDDETALVLTAHSLPQSTIRAGDRYEDEVRACARAIGARLGRGHALAFQSQGPRGEWLRPDLRSVLEDLARQGKTRVAVAPFGFVADHVETLYDLDVEAHGWALDLGMEWTRVPALNDDPCFIAGLASVVRRTLG